MKKHLFICAVLPFFWGCAQRTAPDYSAIESSLVPAVLTGDSAKAVYTVEERMKYFNVPGVSMVVFKDGEIVWNKAYGVREAGSADSVNPETMFQAASISKAVTGFGVLKLVEEHDLDLDADINRYLTSWKIKSPFSEKEKVTIRRLLTHTAGTNISGVMGCEKSDTIPGTTDVLNGKGYTPPLRLDTVPGARFFYSGGGFIVLQQLIEDVSGLRFKDYFDQVVFGPLAMSRSTFDQFPSGNVSSGHNWEGEAYPGGWRVFPAMAAAGLWTTPADLARFCFAVEDAYYGEEGAFISQELAREMLTPLKKRGLGVAIETATKVPFFFHGGSNPGAYRNFMVDVYGERTGMIVMTNAAQGRVLHEDILRSFSGFFNFGIKSPRHVQPAALEKEQLEIFAGDYLIDEELEYPLKVSINSENQLVLFDPNDGMKQSYLPLNDSVFIEVDDGSEISFRTNPATGKVERMNFSGVYTFYKME